VHEARESLAARFDSVTALFNMEKPATSFFMVVKKGRKQVEPKVDQIFSGEQGKTGRLTGIEGRCGGDPSLTRWAEC
jgi:hypothetical protein